MSDAAFQHLHRGVQRALWDLGWKSLRPVQSEAIQTLYTTDHHLLICASTAGGKTEAAFLPVLSRIADTDPASPSIRALYLGPLKALINDQFDRLTRLCQRLDLPVHRWHGDVEASHKQALRQNPRGILLITPESLESTFANYGSLVPSLYRALDFVVIDELHAFLGHERGIHLLSLLSRLRSATLRSPRLIGLSATLGNPRLAQEFLAPDLPDSVHLITDAAPAREIRFALKAVLRSPSSPTSPAPTASPNPSTDSTEANPASDDLDAIADDVIRHFATATNLVFVNSRRVAEELVVRLRDRVTRLRWPHDPFLIHHGSVAREVREEAEATLKGRLPATAICSSTLEMGIDIGNVRAVGQIDPPWSVASLVQRLGRSGRREGESSILRLYVREKSPLPDRSLDDRLFPDLLRAIALARLMQARWLEPADHRRLHLSTLVHQILSHLKQTGGLHAAPLHHALAVLGPFRSITASEFARILRHLGSRDLLEQLPTGELILAPAGERLAGAHDFYASFKTTELYGVHHQKSRIGELPADALPPQGQSLVLAGRRWRVDEIDPRSKAVFVSPAPAGKLPLFRGNAGELHSRVATEMRAVLLATDLPDYLDAPARDLLIAARRTFLDSGLQLAPCVSTPEGLRWFPWLGTRGMRTLAILLRSLDLPCTTDRLSLLLQLDHPADLPPLLRRLRTAQLDPLQLGAQVTPKHLGKFDEFLPDDLLHRAAFQERLDLDAALAAIDAVAATDPAEPR